MGIAATITGTLMDKYTKVNRNGETMYRAVIYQSEAKQSQELGITPQTFNKIEKGKEVSIPTTIDAFKSNQGNVILYAKEIS